MAGLRVRAYFPNGKPNKNTSFLNVLTDLQQILKNVIIRFFCLDLPVCKVTREVVIQ